MDIATSISWEDLPEDGYFGMYTHFSIHETMLKVCVHKLLPCYVITVENSFQVSRDGDTRSRALARSSME